MRAITAVPATIQEIFQKEYHIPDFQRPYSWEEDECAKLWEDILDFYNTKTSNVDKYFLGNIVVNPSSDPEIPALEVVDGQQRLITLTLLIKALFDNASNSKALEGCLKMKNPLTHDVINELRLKTYVISDDMKALENVVLGRNGTNIDNNFEKNYEYFRGMIDDWKKERTSMSVSNEFDKLILLVLNQIVLLPINCETTDDALTIFETINNRGKPLQDSDIFKAKLYAHVEHSKRDAFISSWNNLEDHNGIFRVYMHILRAQNKDVGHVIGLRPYFDKYIINQNVKSVMDNLKLIDKIINNGVDDNDIVCLQAILNTHINNWFTYPLYVFLYKYAKIEKDSDELILSDNKLNEFRKLLKQTIKFIFAKSMIGKAADIKLASFRAYVKIQNGKDYLDEYKLTNNERIKLSACIDTSQWTLKSCRRGIIYLSAYLNNQQDKHDLSQLLTGNVEIEHILPRKWNNYDGWNERTHAEDIDIIGNLLLLSKKSNASATNGFFEYKKKIYAKSTVQDAKDIIHVSKWTRDRLTERNNEKIALLKAFFGIDNI